MRFRITALATLIVFVVLAATAVVLVVVQQRTLTNAVDVGLVQRADDLEASIGAGGLPADLAGGGDETVAQVVELGDAPSGGVVVASSESVAGSEPLADSPPAGDSIVTLDLALVDDDPFRLLSRRITEPEGAFVLHVGVSLDDVRESVNALIRSLLVAIPLVAAILAGLVSWIVGRALEPVESIRSEVAAITGSELHRRVPIPGTDDEIARLAVTMNDMLRRVEDANARQQRFVADASHELRSPLTRMRSEVEVDLAHPETADPAATHRSVLEETEALEALVDDLLVLARNDAGAALPEMVPVDMAEVVRSEVARVDATAIEVTVEATEPAIVKGQAAALARVVRNLLDNAVHHAASAVHIAVDVSDGAVTVRVEDDGPGIPTAARATIFDRFARIDEARTKDKGGTGLGLAIAKEITERHSGTVHLSDPPPLGGATFVVRLPSCAPH